MPVRRRYSASQGHPGRVEALATAQRLAPEGARVEIDTYYGEDWHVRVKLPGEPFWRVGPVSALEDSAR